MDRPPSPTARTPWEAYPHTPAPKVTDEEVLDHMRRKLAAKQADRALLDVEIQMLEAGIRHLETKLAAA